jgi:hypothetical protein
LSRLIDAHSIISVVFPPATVNELTLLVMIFFGRLRIGSCRQSFRPGIDLFVVVAACGGLAKAPIPDAGQGGVLVIALQRSLTPGKRYISI